MKNVAKGVSPLALSNYVAVMPSNSWEQFKKSKARRLALQARLLLDQGGLCAYCEIDLKPACPLGEADLRVEHFHPKSDGATGHNWHLDWQNLLATCHGGSRPDVVDAAQRHTSPDHTCDVPKGDHNWDNVILNPLGLPHTPGLFSYERSSGSMKVDSGKCRTAAVDAVRAQETINRLALDSPRLRGFRKAALDRINQQLITMVQAGQPLEAARQDLARVLLAKNANHHWPPFSRLFAIIWAQQQSSSWPQQATLARLCMKCIPAKARQGESRGGSGVYWL
ncbi:retron system putative HNH endonuclease [Pseudomonas sp. KNUC1026]|uniref:retron system putative HNH endonuclease n=1 Tax=Pseudomonas sp. KNUC1026 TaxID=2893890 RepID=UPI001F23B47B|nr:retron system putative HNH endonuclease [Pseudomonas sp. KNUC1026]UFH48134.1 TIGR02646 family protein [Pseudomonas sp. KNUC1026]